jgi:hypothetical protein
MFQNKTVIVTGGANGIGRSIVQAFANAFANVVVADVDVDAGKTLEKQLLASGKQVFFVETDMRKEEEIRRLVEFTIQKYGGIDVLINNVGISKFIPLFEMSVAEWDDILNTNLRSVFLCSKEAARFMKETGGSIINIASTRAFMSEPNTEGYAASKGGIIALTHALAASLSPYHIRVNSVSPGWIHTGDTSALSERDHKQHWSGRVGEPFDIARACLFLANPENDFINGENITVDGGMTKKMIYEE